MAGAQQALNAHPGVADFLKSVAELGEGGDNNVVHAQTGDTVFPVEHIQGNKQVQKLLRKAFKIAHIDPSRFVVGHKATAKNKQTGLAQFDAEGGGEGPGAEGGGSGPGMGAADGGGTGGTGGGPGGGEVGTGHDLGPSVGGPGFGGGAGPTGEAPSGRSVSELLGIPSLGLAGKIGKTAIGALSGPAGLGLGALGLADTMTAHGVDDPSNPGGNVSSASIGGVGKGLGSDTSPGGANVGGVGGSHGGPGGAAGADDPAMTVAGLLGATPTVFASPATPTATAAATPALTPDKQARIAAYRQQQESGLFNNLSGQGVSPETDSRFIAGSNQINNLTDAEILKTIGG